MYYAFFGLTHAPFKITPDIEVFFEGGNRGAILEALIYAVSQGEGIIKVTGEVGSGKTMLCRMLQTRLPKNVETVYLANPSVSPEEILHAIAFELQIAIPKDAARLEVMHRLNDYLLERHSQQKQVVLFVEESQGMPIGTLEEIRLLSNLETNDHKLLQIVLFGQPELDENLRKPQIRQLRERITHGFTLAPLATKDVRSYLGFRLHAAGYRGPDLFGARVVDYIAKASEGLTRRVNIIADKAMLAAFADGTHNVSLRHAKAAVRDSEFSGKGAPAVRPQWAYVLAGLLAGGMLGILAFAGYETLRGDSGRPDGRPTAAVPAVAAPTMAGASPPISEPALPANAAPTTPASAPPLSAPQADEGSVKTGDLLEQRLQVTARWLAESGETRYSLQLLGSSDTELLRSYFNTITKYLEINDVFVYRTIAKERPSLTVLYGSYGTCAEAAAQIELLPEQFKTNRPYCRTIKGIRAEIASHHS